MKDGTVNESERKNVMKDGTKFTCFSGNGVSSLMYPLYWNTDHSLLANFFQEMHSPDKLKL